MVKPQAWPAMKRSFWLALLYVPVAGCGGGFDDTAGDETIAEEGGDAAADGFRATVTGAVSGRILGPGVIRYLEPTATSFGERPGHYFVADDTGVRDLGITIIIPADTKPGEYPLSSASPLERGTHFEVRVDQTRDDSVLSYSARTAGSVTITSFPPSPAQVESTRVAGHFRFSTRDPAGAGVEANGAFDFAP